MTDGGMSRDDELLERVLIEVNAEPALELDGISAVPWHLAEARIVGWMASQLSDVLQYAIELRLWRVATSLNGVRDELHRAEALLADGVGLAPITPVPQCIILPFPHRGNPNRGT